MFASVAGRLSVSLGTRLIRHADAWALILLITLALHSQRNLLSGEVLLGMDPLTFFFPMYSYLGDRLRSLDVPQWNPYQLSGVPFAADPQSGWMYWPSMLLFVLLPLEAAAKAYIVFHLLLAILTIYALSRVLGLSVPGSVVASIGYGFNGYMLDRLAHCFVCAGITAWLPLSLLGFELATRSRNWALRVSWMGLAAFALSQMLVIWPGQGAYYALLALGGFVAYRTLLSPHDLRLGLRARFAALMLYGGSLLLFATSLAAGQLLPMLEYNSLSTLAGGYRSDQARGGWAAGQQAVVLFRNNWHYMGTSVFVLTLVAPIYAGLRHAIPYWTALAFGTLVLTVTSLTPLHSVLYLLPRFEHLHPHHPARIMMLFYLSAALLAGATVTHATNRGKRSAWGLLIPTLLLGVMQSTGELNISTTVLFLLITVIALTVAYSAVRSYQWIPLTCLIVLILVDLSTARSNVVAQQLSIRNAESLRRVNLEDYYSRPTVVDYLETRNEQEPFRYASFEPRLRPYQWRYMYPDRVGPLMVNNRGTLHNLEDVQGYNPVQIARYSQYFEALNSGTQGYRALYLYSAGLRSPLLDLLNARYIIVPAGLPGRRDMQYVERNHRVAYEGDGVLVYERPNAFPRAWIVHSTRQVQPSEALSLLSSGEVDPRHTVLLEEVPPHTENALRGINSSEITKYAPERIDVETQTAMPGMLVLSEPYYPAWRAYVDNKPARLYVANHAFRAISIPAGRHSVTLRYESTSLRLGLAISAASYLLLGAILLSVSYPYLRRVRSVVGRGRGRIR